MNFFYNFAADCKLMQEIKVLSPYRQALRDRILDTAIRLFIQHGVRSVKMDDVARELTISKRTLYEIYDNKEQVLFESIRKYRLRRRQELENTVRESANVMDIILYIYREKIKEFQLVNPLFYSDLGRYPKIMESFQQDHQEQQQQFMAFMERGVSEGYFRKDLDYELIGRIFDALGRYMMENELYRSYSMKELFRNMIFVSLRGFCTKKGVDTLDTFL
jgi:AcrR family transcriptional regulator